MKILEELNILGFMKKDNKELNKVMKFNILAIIGLFILKIIDIELTRYALSTGKATEVNPIMVFMFKQNIFVLYFFTLLPFILLVVLVFYCYISEELKILKIAKIGIIFLIAQNLFLVVNGVYQLLLIIGVVK